MAHLVNSDIGLNFGATDAPDHWTSVYIERSSSLANGAKATATIFTSDGNMLPDTNNQYIGSSNRRWEATYSNYINAADSVDSPRYFGYNYQVRFDRDDMRNVTKVTDKQDLLDFIVNKVNVYRYSAKEVDDAVGAPDEISYQEYYGLLAEDFTTHSSNTNCGGSEVAYNIMKNLLTDDTNGDGELNKNDGHNKHTYNLPALVTTLIGAFQQHVENGDDGGGEEIDLSAYATKTYVDDEIDKTKKYVDDAIDNIEVSGSGDCDFNKYFSYDDTAYYYGSNSLLCHEPLVVNSRMIIDGDVGSGLVIMGDAVAELSKIEAVDSITFSDGSKMTTAGGGNTTNHTHDRLTNGGKSLLFTSQTGVNGYYDTSSLSTLDHSIDFTTKRQSSSYIDWAKLYIKEKVTGKTASIFTNTNNLIPISDSIHSIGSANYHWKDGYINNIESDNVKSDNIDASNIEAGVIDAAKIDVWTAKVTTLEVDDVKVNDIYDVKRITVDYVDNVITDSHSYFLPCSKKNMVSPVQKIDATSSISKQKILNLILDLNVYKCISSELDSTQSNKGIDMGDFLNVLDEEIINHISNNTCNYQEVAELIFRNRIYDSNNNGYFESGELNTHSEHIYNLPSLVSALIAAFQQHVNNYSDASLKENVRYLNSMPDIEEGEEPPDFLERADLHDFIVNQVNLCEFNYIDDMIEKIGFIANDYEGTKVGDKIVFRRNDTLTYDLNNLVFATIGALQEEVRIKDEKIASLESRLARIEEMLNNN